MANQTFTSKELRQTFGCFPTGVTVITTKDADGAPIGVTASSFNSVSMDPPLILWSVDKVAYSASIFKNAKHFTVNILSDAQVDISNRFASRGEDKFKDIDWCDDEHGMPNIADASAQLRCNTWNVYEGGDHYIIVGEVMSLANNQKPPLVFATGGYCIAQPHPSC